MNINFLNDIFLKRANNSTFILSSVKIGHHFGMHCHASSDVDDIIYSANCVQK